MESFVVINMIVILTAFVLIGFAVFAIGFLIGYVIENHKTVKRREETLNNKNEESEQEKKAKKEWKKFLEYDGSAPQGVE